MPIHSDTNLYPGINPHLNSYLQHVTGWRGFHRQHLSHLTDAIEAVLPEGYYTSNEDSLQVGVYDTQTNISVRKSDLTVTDITIYAQDAPAKSSPIPTVVSAPTLTFPVIEMTDEEEYLGSVVIYYMQEGQFPGTPVTRVELLSPANKPSGSHYDIYLAKRLQTLGSGLRIVEVDYLHERRPIIARIPSYVDRQPGAHPYNIIVNDPRPTFLEGQTQVYGFGVLDRPPIIAVPLAGDDRMVLDIQAIYNRTVESSRLFRLVLVDYAQEPVNFAAYTEADQARIRERMAAIAAEQP